jgi:hypothetical protein
MQKLEDVYKNEIHPLVERIVLLCKQTNMPCFLTFQDGIDGFRTTSVNEHYSDFEKMKYYRWINGAWSLDDFFKQVISDAKENGHDSLYLKAMGVPEIPKESRSLPKRDLG